MIAFKFELGKTYTSRGGETLTPVLEIERGADAGNCWNVRIGNSKHQVLRYSPGGYCYGLCEDSVRGLPHNYEVEGSWMEAVIGYPVERATNPDLALPAPADTEDEDDTLWRDAARRLYADGDDTVVDTDATVSHGDPNEGAFVQAWVWVPADEIDDTDD